MTGHPHPCRTCGTTDAEAFDTPTGAWCRECWSQSLADSRRDSFTRMHDAARPTHRAGVSGLTGRRKQR
jgi:hypothetical protein